MVLPYPSGSLLCHAQYWMPNWASLCPVGVAMT
jgi:hypothetical protein